MIVVAWVDLEVGEGEVCLQGGGRGVPCGVVGGGACGRGCV